MAKKKTPSGEEPPSTVAVEVMEEKSDQSADALTTGEIQTSFHDKHRRDMTKDYSGNFPIVGIGASAGGIESYTELLSNLPDKLDMAIVIVQHLAPKHDSLLPSILSRVTPMEVLKAEDDMTVVAGKVYVIPPNVNMGIIHGVLKLMPRLEKPNRHMPIDFFFRCLADDQNHLAIAIILSGADGDGAQGLRAVRAQGGITLVQDPKTAKVDGMPRSAIAAGGTDTILSIPELARELVRLSQHPWIRREQGDNVRAEDLDEIFQILRARTGVDFSRYKKGTILRRLRRRIMLHKVAGVLDYCELLRGDDLEVSELYRDLLINVTSFFRDAEVFAKLKKTVMPTILSRMSPGQTLRIWVPGCATGEEAYTMAMTVLEAMDETGINVPVQIFATDLSEAALDKAREGYYPESVIVDVSTDRLRRFFVKSNGNYRVSSQLREICVFARHDVTRDPPFSRMDLISCRNLLIYLEAAQQQRVLNLFAYALNPAGFLMLGRSETATNVDTFDLHDKDSKFFVRKSVTNRAQIDVSINYAVQRQTSFKGAAKSNDPQAELERVVARTLNARYSPPAVVVNAAMNAVHFSGPTGRFLEQPTGEPSFNILKLARPGIESDVRILLKASEKSGRPETKPNCFLLGSESEPFGIEVIPLRLQDESGYFLIVFDSRTVMEGIATEFRRPTPVPPPPENAGQEVTRVHDELVAMREHLQSIIREQDITNEELQAANEEVLSSNEELQSTNEELETTKEELQSSNEELSTVNDELTNRNTMLLKANNDFSNLLASVDLPIIMVGNDLKIRRFTPMVDRAFKIIPTDIGRPITDIRSNINVPDLEEMILETIETMQTIEREVEDVSGHLFSLRIRPYRTSDNKIDGAVIILVDIGLMKRSDEQLRQFQSLNESLVDTINQPIFFLDEKMRVRKTNRATLRSFQMRETEMIGRNFFELADGVWDSPILKALFAEIIPRNTSVSEFQLDQNLSGVTRSFIVNARRIHRDGAINVMVILDEISEPS